MTWVERIRKGECSAEECSVARRVGASEGGERSEGGPVRFT